MLISTAFASCTNESEDIQPLQSHQGTNLDIQVGIDKSIVSRALITGQNLIDGSRVGITVVDATGTAYQDQDYNNVCYTAATVDGKQQWTPDKDVTLSGESATLYAYYPWTDGVDVSAIPVDMTEADQTDWMYATPVEGLNDANATAQVKLHHALANVKLTLYKESYSGAGEVTAFSVKSDGAATGGTLNAKTGAFTETVNEGQAITRTVTYTLTDKASATPFDCMVVPTDTNAAMTVTVTVDGHTYSSTTDAFTLAKATAYNLALKLTSTGLTVTSVMFIGDIDGMQLSYEHNNDNSITVTAVADDATTFVDDNVYADNATVATSYDEDDNLIVRLTDIEGDIALTMAGVRPRTMNFAYTGAVQDVTLPQGTYKLQCWGAQGGTSAGSNNGTGSKGGYAEGQLTLDKTTTLYAFVGGQGSRGTTSTMVNGGWNGGGAAVGLSSYNSGDTNGYSTPACGGGATDFATVTSTMTYSGGRTNRSSASLLSRCIVAGGGAGGSYRHKTVTTETSTSSWELVQQGITGYIMIDADGKYTYYLNPTTGLDGSTYKVIISNTSNLASIQWTGRGADGTAYIYQSISNNTGFVPQTSTDTKISYYQINVRYNVQPSVSPTLSIYKLVETPSTSTSTSSSYSNKSQVGGGTSGGGSYPGTQFAAGGGNYVGGFGYGANQSITNYRYAAGGAGGGWYGGGTSYSDSSTGYINYSGGGSGFVNTTANAGYRPSGYTGLLLDSGTTTAGNASHPSTSGGTETGHSGNGYARITRIK